jgi:TAT (twin-arginine translocation) pathway signal sequence
MERRQFLKFGLGVVAGATALAASANAAPLLPVQAMQGLAPPQGNAAEPALVTGSEVDHLEPEQVHWRHRHWRWHHHWHRRHWGWRHWHHRHWHRRWHRHHW